MATRVKVRLSTSELVGSSDPPYDRSLRRSAISGCWNGWRLSSLQPFARNPGTAASGQIGPFVIREGNGEP
jgi:hypothetical protein